MQVLVHGIILASSAIAAFIPARSQLHGVGGGNPVYDCLTLLWGSIGLPYFALSSTTPLIQAWYARTSYTGLPYRLFALSNLGSLIALIAYPFAIERLLELDSQFAIWRWTYLGFVLLCLLIAICSLRHRSDSPMAWLGLSASLSGNWRRNLTWIALAACSSALLLAVTNTLCQNVAPIPLLWIVPLTIYLITFVLAFDHDDLFRPAVYRLLVPIALVALVWAEADPRRGIGATLGLYLSSLFVVCMFCHGQLSRIKPASRDLTSFYLCLSLGGALGGIFVALLAPGLFSDFFELKLAICACLVLSLRFLFDYRSKPFLLTCGLVAIVALRVYGSIGGIPKTFQQRNFYGVLSIWDTKDSAGNTVRALLHGACRHGTQVLTGKDRLEPASYYGRESGVGLTLQRSASPCRVAVIGLGAGTLAAYGRPGDTYRFYELNPLVAQLADSRFTYLRDSKARVELKLGDGRLSLEREPAEHFDTLILDAFSGDSIPIHLLTREAFQSYFHHLNEGGVLAVHITNQYVDLRPVVADIAASFGRSALHVSSPDDPRRNITIADWVLVSTDTAFLKQLDRSGRGRFIAPTHGRPWTDQYSNVFATLR